MRLLEELRAAAPPRALIGGEAAFFVDQRHAIAARLPLTLALVSMLAMFLASGSVVVAAKALAMAGLSMTTGLGVLVTVFQHAAVAGVLGLQHTGGVEEATLVFLASIALATLSERAVVYCAGGSDRSQAAKR